MVDAPTIKELVLLGGGHAHIEVLRRFAMAPPPATQLTLISQSVETPYSGMLPGHVAGCYAHDDIHIDLVPLARAAGARFYRDEVVGLDPEKKLVLCRDRPPVSYDLLSVDTGSTPDLSVPGAAGNVVPVKPIHGFLAHWNRLRERVLAASGTLRIGVVGAGAGGVEILLAVRARLRDLLRQAGRGVEHLEFHLFCADAEIMSGHNAHVRRALAAVLAQAGVVVHRSCPIDHVERGRVRSGARAFDLDEILWVTRAAAPPWPGAAGLATDESGFIAVDVSLRSLSHRDVFAAGDIASVAGQPRPKAGVFAVRQGPHVASNLRLALAGHEPRPVRLQRRALALIATADGCAIASRGPWFARGHWLWRLKDRIDRRFMTKYRDLPAMPVAPIPLDAMRCGGCGAKIGAQMLSEALAELQPTQRPDVVLGLAERDDAAAVTVPPGKVAVHSVDHFRAFVDDPYLFGRIAANHALGDLFAMNAEPQTALAICTLPFGPERRTVATLKDMLVGALSVFDAHGASLVGGHTSEGAELALGFAVNGLADPARLTRKSGLRPGDRLILAKPLGTGALLAANMRGKCNGRWLDGALVSMQLSSRDAARIFAAHGARATTDVTGFGLAGHLAEMLRASGVRAALDLDAIPILDGAAETMAAGIFSTLQQQNAQAVATDLHAPGSRQAILFDPQTAGGLLAGVPEADAAACLAALREIYPQAAIIGAVLPAGGGALIEVD